MSMKLLQPESVEEIELVEYAENTEKSRNTIKVSEISICTLEAEKLMRLLIVFRVLLPSNGFPCSLTERVCSSKFGSYNHNN